MQNVKARDRRFVIIFVMLAAGFVLSNCYTNYYFPVEVEEVKVSPPYRLDIKNDTSQLLVFLPRDGAGEGVNEKEISIGMKFSTLLQIKKIKVGETSTREVIAGLYIDSGRLGPDTAIIKFRDSRRERDFSIDLKSELWFEEYQTRGMGAEPQLKVLKVSLTEQNLSKPKWFRNGPDRP